MQPHKTRRSSPKMQPSQSSECRSRLKTAHCAFRKMKYQISEPLLCKKNASETPIYQAENATKQCPNGLNKVDIDRNEHTSPLCLKTQMNPLLSISENTAKQRCTVTENAVVVLLSSRLKTQLFQGYCRLKTLLLHPSAVLKTQQPALSLCLLMITEDDKEPQSSDSQQK